MALTMLSTRVASTKGIAVVVTHGLVGWVLCGASLSISISLSGAPWLLMGGATGDKVLKLAVKSDGPRLSFAKDNKHFNSQNPSVVGIVVGRFHFAFTEQRGRAKSSPSH